MGKLTRWHVVSTIISAIFFGSVYAAETVNFNQVKAQTGSDLALKKLNSLDSKYQFRQSNQIKLSNGKVRFKFDQYYNDVPVWNTGIITNKSSVEDIKTGDYITGSYLVDIEKDITTTRPGLSKIQAVNKALQFANINDSKSIKGTAADLVIRNFDTEAKLVYIINFFVDADKPTRPFFMLDANTGEVLEQWDGLMSRNFHKNYSMSFAIGNILGLTSFV